MEIGKKLRTLRAERGFTQEKMADLLSIPQASYSNLENNKGKIDLKTIQKIAEIYEMDVIDLLKDEGLSFHQNKKKGDNNGLVMNQISDKLIEQYEIRLKEKDEAIADLKQVIKELKG
nr:helix-turn-helix transcriptional regulator [uncultured Flavobacterium sp.]